jgi:hypothetical protein
MMKKVGALLNSGLSLKANARPSMQDIEEITATGQFTYKCEKSGQLLNFPSI